MYCVYVTTLERNCQRFNLLFADSTIQRRFVTSLELLASVVCWFTVLFRNAGISHLKPEVCNCFNSIAKPTSRINMSFSFSQSTIPSALVFYMLIKMCASLFLPSAKNGLITTYDIPISTSDYHGFYEWVTFMHWKTSTLLGIRTTFLDTCIYLGAVHYKNNYIIYPVIKKVLLQRQLCDFQLFRNV